MRICFVTSPRFNCKPERKSLPPVGLASLAAFARQAGHQVSAVEGVLLGAPGRIAAAVAAFEPDVVASSTVTQDRLAHLVTLREIRRACPGAFIVVGGSHYTHSAISALNTIDAIDAVACGEGEHTLIELLDRLHDHADLADVAGLTWRDADGEVRHNEPRPLITDLDSLPMPAWDLFGLGDYARDGSHLDTGGEASAPIAGVTTSRGCPQSCVFCANGVPTKVRFLSPAKSVDQFEYLQKTFGVSELEIYDDNFYSSESHVVGLCEELLGRNLSFRWWAGIRLKNLNIDVLRLMKRAGCQALSFGVETGTDEVLKAARKNITTAQMLEAMETVAAVGFERLGVFLILGLPEETLDTIDRTVAFLRTLRAMAGPAWTAKSSIGQLPLIFPGTGLETLGRVEGCLPANFNWHTPYLEPHRHLPLANHRYQTVPHFQTRSLPLPIICDHIRRHHWASLTDGRKRRYHLRPLRRMKAALVRG